MLESLETIQMIFTYLAVVVFSSIFGSFLNVLILRIHSNDNWWTDRSKCPHCKKELTWYELIPVLSFLMLGGKCRNCSTKISIQYPIVESVSVFLGVFLTWKFGLQPITLLYFFVGWMLLGSFVSDLLFMELPEIFSWSVFVLGVIYQIFFTQIEIPYVIFGIVFGFLFFWIQYFLTNGKGLGEGDIRLGLIMGIFLAWPMTIYSIFASYILATFILIPFMLAKKIGRKTAVPLGVFLIPTFLIFLYFQDEIMKMISSIFFFY